MAYQGDGSVFQRKDGLWVAKIKNPYTKTVKYFYGHKKSEVKDKLKEYKKTIGLSDENVEKLYVDDFFSDWLTEELSLSLKPKSYDIKEYIIDKVIIPYFKGMQAGKVTPRDIQGFISYLSRKEYSFSVIKKAYDTLNQRYSLAVQRRELSFNPVVGITLPKTEDRRVKEIRVFTEDELRSILTAAHAVYPTGTQIYRHGYLIDFLLYTGVRIGEALALTWKDIDLDNNKITICKNLVEVRDRDGKNRYKAVVQQTPKTKAGDRVIPLSEKAKNAVITTAELQGHSVDDKSSNDIVFSVDGKTHLINRNVTRMFSLIQKRAGIENTGTLHSLRHTFASRLICLGVDIKVISKLLGHSDISITYNTYVHIIESQQTEAVEKLDLI